MSSKKEPKLNSEKKDETKERRGKIIEIISTSKIESQEKLLIRLRGSGFAEASQPTLSRDFRALGIIKDQDTGYYTLDKQSEIQQQRMKFKGVGQENITELIDEPFFFAFKTNRGQARSTSVIIEQTFKNDVVGTISGDDTALIIVKDENTANKIISEIQAVLKK